MRPPLVSVIITTRNSANTLERLLRSIKNQTYKKIEVILIDNSSTDNTKKIALKYTKNVFNKGPERSVQRNFGAKKARGEYFLFLDSDMKLTKNIILECVKKFTNKVIYGGVIIPEKSFGKSFWAKTKALEREINLGELFFEAARFFPKKIFEQFKGFDEDITGPEDWDLPRRIEKKYRMARIKSYILHDEGCLALFTLFNKKYYYGLSANKFLKKQKKSIFTPTTIYLLRPAFYKNWRLLLKHPKVSLGMFFMLTVETIGGGLGFLKGKLIK